MIADFVPGFLAGFCVNVEIAACAVIAGLGFGLPLALLRIHVPPLRRAVRLVSMLMQAAPVYVIMFFALNIMPKTVVVLGAPLAIGGVAVVIVSQSVNMAAYMCENLVSAIEHWRARRHDQAMLLLPSILRGFFIVLMSSGFGAAIGVVEAVGVTLRQAERLPELGERVRLFLGVIAFFVAILGFANYAVSGLIRRWSRPAPGQGAQ